MWQADPVTPSVPADDQTEARVENQPDAVDREAIARLLDDGCPLGRDGE